MSIDITPLVNRAAEQGLIVAHEARYLSLDLGDHGRYVVSVQMTDHGPKVLSAVPAPGGAANAAQVRSTQLRPPSTDGASVSQALELIWSTEPNRTQYCHQLFTLDASFLFLLNC